MDDTDPPIGAPGRASGPPNAPSGGSPRVPTLLVEDEPELLSHLERQLKAFWPEIDMLPHAHNGSHAISLALAHLPSVIFLDIHLPAVSGLDAAQAIIEDWPDGRELPRLVFVTAYHQYALQAFDQGAVDYLLKPVSTDRLRTTVERLQRSLRPATARGMDVEAEALGESLRDLSSAARPVSAGPRLTVITAASGNLTHVIPIEDVIYFEAVEKYVRVVTADREALIRMTLRELAARVDPDRFWQIHRSLVVHIQRVSHVERNELGRLMLCLQGSPLRLAVSRLYAHRFKSM